MWIILASLMLVPLAVAIVILGRVLGGNPALTDRERRLFGDSQNKTLSIWRWLKFAGIVMIFFVLGFLEGTVLINLGPVWMVLAPLVTGIGAMLILMLWLQEPDHKESLVARVHRTDSQRETHETHQQNRRTKRRRARTGKARSATFSA